MVGADDSWTSLALFHPPLVGGRTITCGGMNRPMIDAGHVQTVDGVERGTLRLHGLDHGVVVQVVSTAVVQWRKQDRKYKRRLFVFFKLNTPVIEKDNKMKR